MSGREILFKAKDKSGNWAVGYYIKHLPYTPSPISSDIEGDTKKDEEATKHLIARDGFSDWGMSRNIRLIEIDPKTLCQYIGLKDDNKRRIFENDIIVYQGEDGVFESQIIFKGGDITCGLQTEFGINYATVEDISERFSEEQKTMDFYVRVVGNVFDSLKDKNGRV